jgi:serine protease Do
MRRSLASASLLLLLGCRAREAAPDAGGIDAAPVAVVGGPRLAQVAGRASFVDIVSDASAAVVAIRATSPIKNGPAAMYPGAQDASDTALGTGFLIEHRGTYVLTNLHIAAAASELRVVVGNTETTATVAGRDDLLDVALLEVHLPRAPALTLGTSADLHVGEWIVALGNPFGEEVTASVGVVAATAPRKGCPAVGVPPTVFRSFIETDARIHRGNSGGPVLDTTGKVVGIATTSGDRNGEVGFVIPIDCVRGHLDLLRDVGVVDRAFMGMMVTAVPADIAQQLPETGGAVITEVVPASPATKAGLSPGDVILRWNDAPIDHRSITGMMASAAPGKKVRLLVWRRGATVQVDAIPARAPQ